MILSWFQCRWSFSHHRLFISIGQEIGYCWFFAIIAFYSIGGYWFSLLPDLLVFLSDKILKRILGFNFKRS